MKGVKCTGFLILLGLLALSFLTCSDVSALKHEYIGIPYGSFSVPCPSWDSSSGKFSLDWSTYNFCEVSDGSGLSLQFKGDSFVSSYSNLSQRFSASYLGLNLDGSDSVYSSLNPIYHFNSDNTEVFTGFNGTVLHRNWELSALSVDKPILDVPIRSFNIDSVPIGLLSCGKENGAVCGGLWNTREYVSSQILPYDYSSSGFYLKSHAISQNGITYSNTFAFNDMFNSSIPRFSYLSIPLHTFDGYFIDSDNLWSGRQIEFAGAFEFDGSFDWHENIIQNGSFKLKFQGIPLYSQDGNWNWHDQSVDCTTNLIQLTLPDTSDSSYTRLDYSCPVSLDMDYVMISGPRLEISGNDNYVWRTDKEWRFAQTFIVTDNDDTPGYNFNDEITGGGTIVGDAENEIPDQSGMWQMDAATLDALIDNFFPNLMGMFNFNLFNPFISIFGLFTSGEDCVNVPIFASMIHSDNPQVCPWFPGWVRNITTPVMSIVSTMLLFGFMLRWVRSSSSDFSPDSSGGKP